MGELVIYTLYNHPVDYPDEFVIRRFTVSKGSNLPVPDNELFFRSISLQKCQDKMKEMRLYRMLRDNSDEPKIIESYI